MGLRVELHGEDRQLSMSHSFYRPVVQVCDCDFKPCFLSGYWVYGETMVLRCDVHLTFELDRLIDSPVAELELVGL